MPAPPLACTVRDCGLFLERRARTLVCARGHSFDVARSGYVNLLQPQDRRSPAAGDPRKAVEARARLLAAGIGLPLLDAMVERAVGWLPRADPVVVDLGSGSGDALAALTRRVECLAVGVDLSVAAADFAARRFPHVTWVVANADRRIPLLDVSVDLVWSLHGRRNPVDCARVLTRDGVVLLGTPAPDDLIELREAVQGRRLERDRVPAIVAEHAHAFELVEHHTARDRRRLDPDQLRDVLRATYRGERRSAASAREQLQAMDVTFASEVIVLARKPA